MLITALALSVTALFGLVELWAAQSWRQNALNWGAADWHDTGELQKELQRLRPTRKARFPDDGGAD
jgi:hypothetical protein